MCNLDNCQHRHVKTPINHMLMPVLMPSRLAEISRVVSQIRDPFYMLDASLLNDQQQKQSSFDNKLFCIYDRIQRLFKQKKELLRRVTKQSQLVCSQLQRSFSRLNYLIQKKKKFNFAQIKENQVSSPLNRLMCKLLKKVDFKFQIRLLSTIPCTLFKDRNFSLQLQIVDREGRRVRHINKIMISLAIFVDRQNPSIIQTNLSNQPIIRIGYQNFFINGHSLISKIKISQVTSHFPGGTASLAIFAKSSWNGDKLISQNEIKPLVLQDLVIKAKKIKLTISDK